MEERFRIWSKKQSIRPQPPISTHNVRTRRIRGIRTPWDSVYPPGTMYGVSRLEHIVIRKIAGYSPLLIHLCEEVTFQQKESSRKPVC